MESAEDEADCDQASEVARLSNEAASRYAALRNHSIRFEDAIDPNAERVDKLRKNDIVFGRGKGFQNHPGNQRMRDIVEKYKVQYHSLKRAEKRKMVESVYKEIAGGGARFLKKVDGENAWVMVDAPVAIQKVSHTLRCRKNAEENPAKGKSDGLDDSADTSAPGTESNHSHQALIHMLNNNSATMYGMAGNAPSLAALYNRASGNPGLGIGTLGGPLGLTGLDSSQLAVLPGARFGGLGRLPLSIPSGIDYYNQIRQQQFLREQMLFQQMGDAAMRNSSRMGTANSIVAQRDLLLSQRSKPDTDGSTEKKEGNSGGPAK